MHRAIMQGRESVLLLFGLGAGLAPRRPIGSLPALQRSKRTFRVKLQPVRVLAKGECLVWIGIGISLGEESCSFGQFETMVVALHDVEFTR